MFTQKLSYAKTKMGYIQKLLIIAMLIYFYIIINFIKMELFETVPLNIKNLLYDLFLMFNGVVVSPIFAIYMIVFGENVIYDLFLIFIVIGAIPYFCHYYVIS